MKGKLSTLVFVLILTALILGGCGPGPAQPTEVPTATPAELPTATPTQVAVETPESAVTISPTGGPSGPLVTVVASGFPSNTPVSVGVGPVASEFSEVAQGTTDANGVFTVQVPVQGGPGLDLVLAVAAEGQPGVSSPDLFHITD